MAHRSETMQGTHGSQSGVQQELPANNVIPIDIHQRREEGLDETLAQTFPCSDPLSSLPDPGWKRERLS